MSDDLINKKEALTLLRKRSQQLVGIYGDLGGALSGAAKLINELPAADRPQGEWTGGDVPTRCSICGHDWDEYVEGQEIWYEGSIPNFCPNCGADMRKGVDNE